MNSQINRIFFYSKKHVGRSTTVSQRASTKRYKCYLHSSWSPLKPTYVTQWRRRRFWGWQQETHVYTRTWISRRIHFPDWLLSTVSVILWIDVLLAVTSRHTTCKEFMNIFATTQSMACTIYASQQVVLTQMV